MTHRPDLPRLVLMCGLPGAGKTTLAWRLAARNADAPWGTVAITRAQLVEWLPFFQAPDADEGALFDAPLVP